MKFSLQVYINNTEKKENILPSKIEIEDFPAKLLHEKIEISENPLIKSSIKQTKKENIEIKMKKEEMEEKKGLNLAADKKINSPDIKNKQVYKEWGKLKSNNPKLDKITWKEESLLYNKNSNKETNKIFQNNMKFWGKNKWKTEEEK